SFDCFCPHRSQDRTSSAASSCSESHCRVCFPSTSLHLFPPFSTFLHLSPECARAIIQFRSHHICIPTTTASILCHNQTRQMIAHGAKQSPRISHCRITNTP